MEVLTTIMSIVQLIAAVALLAIVMSQATKSEGLTGTIGGKAESAFRGKPGGEEKLAYVTKVAAITFIVTSAIVGYLHMV
ncbi:MAG: preprotein translocase subunit SecG [Armatimonadetes bacterium]|nr:preprotein translocase subunit SecG [Armatimonadota bacterium]